MTQVRNADVLILGGTGTMGSYLVKELLSLGFRVTVTSRTKRFTNEKELIYVQGNAKEDKFLADITRTKKFHAIVDFMLYTTEEFTLRYNMMLNCTEHYLYLSSYRVYSESKKEMMSESHPRLLDNSKDDKYLSTDEYALAKARQEDLLIKSSKKNWTILRPAITYSKDRFFLGIADTSGFLFRALEGKPIIFPKEILDRETTMTWAGDAAKMIALLVGHKDSFSEIVNISTSEHHSWRQVLNYYQTFLDIKVKIISVEEYVRVYKLKYLLKYNRMYDRMIDNSKVLSLTGLKQNELVPLRDGLRMELGIFTKNPKYAAIDENREKIIDNITKSNLQKFRDKAMPRTRIRQLKSILKSRFKYDGAIVTLTVYNNYGNIIQRYALQSFLAKHGFRFNMLDLHKGKVNKNHKQLKKFADKYLHQDKFDRRLAKYYKIYIVGSDQVWRHFSVNKKWSNFGIQFLSFVANMHPKRIAYAASFGVDTLDAAGIVGTRKDKIIQLMKKFDAISVRENSGIKMVEELGGLDSVQALDPTFLLSASDYTRLIDRSEIKYKKASAVFYYLIDPTPLTQSAIEYYEKTNNVKAQGILPYLHPYRGIALSTMEEWLKNIRDANIVVADSYHAVVFSIIFHTDFVVFDKKGGGIARIAELLGLLGMSDRIVVQGKKKAFKPNYRPINWDKVDSILERKRRGSSEWLLEALTRDSYNPKS